MIEHLACRKRAYGRMDVRFVIWFPRRRAERNCTVTRAKVSLCSIRLFAKQRRIGDALGSHESVSRRTTDDSGASSRHLTSFVGVCYALQRMRPLSISWADVLL
jgi:hypothetical protein